MEDEKKILEQLKEIDEEEGQDNKVTLASLKTHKSAIYNRDVDLQTKIKLRTLNETLKSENIKIYFCSLCGKKAVGANVGLDTLSNRKSDNTVAVNMKQIFIQLFLKQEGIKYIKRQDKVEKQYRWCCEECGVHIAYQCIPYEEGQALLSGNLQMECSNRPYLYILNDAIVINQSFSKLHSEVAKMKESMDYDNYNYK